tara:strand:+ start:3348 stop:3962 length:615 start_codon:yes stop_codon:yes gene_type:complete
MNQKIINLAIIHLNKDLKLKKIIDKHDKPIFEKNNDYYDSLSKSIIYQQLSGRVAKVIYYRFLDIFDDRKPNPNIILNISDIELKNIGLSNQKTSYIKDLSKYFLEKGESTNFELLNDHEIRQELISIKGIGHWTIDMFLMFTILRPNILPTGDLGIKNGFKKLFNLKELPKDDYMLKKSEPWEPYRTIACYYLWRLVDDEDFW